MASFSEVGKTWQDPEQFVKDFYKFCDENYQPLFIETNNKKQVRLLCRHGKYRASSSKGDRVKQRYNYLGCTAKITCYKPANSSTIKVTSVNLEHNHEISESAYNQVKLEEEEKEVIVDLHEANCKPSEISRVVKNKFEKKLSTQKIRNLLQKIKSTDADSTEMLRDFLEKIEDEKGTVDYKLDTDGKISVLFVSSHPMQKAFIDACCTCVQIDTSFDFDASKYKLCAFCYLNPTTNKSELCALSFISQETAQNFTDVFQCFKKICIQLPSVFILDKDFNEIAVLRKIFPNSRILLCKFHVIKYVKNLVATATVTVEKKNEIMNSFKAALYSRSQSDYELKKKEFLESSKDVQVRVQKKYVLLEDQFINNWDNCKEMWVMHYRSTLPTLGDSTNNRIERSFGVLKESIKNRFPSLPVIEKSIVHLVTFCEQRVTDVIIHKNMKSLKIFDADPQIRALNEKASLSLNDRGCIVFDQSLKALKNRREFMMVEVNGVREQFKENQEKLYVTSATECDCTFHCTNQSPCRHILLKREHVKLPIFELTLFHKRYHKKNFVSLEEDSLQDEIVDQEIDLSLEDFVEENITDKRVVKEKTLSSREKYNMVLPVALQIASLVSNHGTAQFESYLSTLKTMENMVRDGADIHCLPTHLMNDVASQVEKINQETQTDYEDQGGSSTNSKDQDCESHVSRFQKLQFKSKLQARGRPKRPDRQLCSFNKSIADRESSNNKMKKRKREESETEKESEEVNVCKKK